MKEVTIPAQCLLDSSSQHDHGGYLCMGINTSPKLTEELTSLSLSSQSVSRDRLESLAREKLPPCLPSFPHSPSHSPSSFTFNQRDYLQKCSLRIDYESNVLIYLTPRRQDVHQPARLPSMVSTTTEAAPVAKAYTGGGPRHWSPTKKRQRRMHAQHW